MGASLHHQTITLKNCLMKKLILIVIMAATLGACKKEKSATPAPVKTNPPVEDSVILPTGDEGLKLTIVKVNTPVAAHTAGNTYLWFEMMNGSIYFGSPSNTSSLKQYFDKYDISTNKFTSLDTTLNVCACGYMSTMIADKVGNIYYFGNDATKYSASKDLWENIEFQPNAKNNHGESGAIYLNNKIYYIGGREASTTVKYYNTQDAKWYYAADFPSRTNMSDGIAAGNKMYVLGGSQAKSQFSIYDEPSNTWTTQPELPFTMDYIYGQHKVATLNNNIFALSGGKIHVYDIVAKKWSANPISFSYQLNNANLFSSNGKLYIVGTNATHDFQLYEASISK
jgi:hypothetical protein